MKDPVLSQPLTVLDGADIAASDGPPGTFDPQHSIRLVVSARLDGRPAYDPMR
jgi:hypothetical protein